MSTKSQSPGTVPAVNRPHTDTDDELQEQDESGKTAGPKSRIGGQEEDEQRHSGEFTSKSEAARQQ